MPTRSQWEATGKASGWTGTDLDGWMAKFDAKYGGAPAPAPTTPSRTPTEHAASGPR